MGNPGLLKRHGRQLLSRLPSSVAAKVRKQPPAVSTTREPVALSLVIPVYNVEKYLGDLLGALTRQQQGPYSLECIFVDDGSTDTGPDLIKGWIKTERPAWIRARMITQVNAGVCAARNAGLDAATGDWISFPDSDDFPAEDYCLRIAEFLCSSTRAEPQLVSGKIIKYDEATGELLENHSLNFKFKGSAKVVDLRASPHYVQMMVSSAFFHAGAIQQAKAWFIEGLHASEDALFVATVLAEAAEPIVGVVPKARFFYRKRASGDSAVDTFRDNEATYFDRFEQGYLPLLTSHADPKSGHSPEWLGTQLLYELRWLFGRELKIESKALKLDQRQRAAVLEQTRRMLAFVADETILGYRVTSMPYELRILLLALKGSPVPQHRIHLTELDQGRNLIRLSYYFLGDLPDEEIRVRAKNVSPAFAKVRHLDYFGQQLLAERIIWIPANSWISVDLDGRRAELVLGSPQAPLYAVTEKQTGEFFRTEAEPPRPQPAPPAQWNRPLSIGFGKWLATTGLARLLFRDSWVFTDRLEQANDNAEHLYRWVGRHHREIRRWYVLRRSSPDWDRLRSEGFRMLRYGSAKHLLVMLNAKNLISSHADAAVARPIDPLYHGGDETRPWNYVFLQHGVTQADISAWMNMRNPDLFITATEDERQSICADGSGYRHTGKEVVLTGFPRFDRLVRLAERRGKPADTILVAPTWRSSLFGPRVGAGGRRLVRPGFSESVYATNWGGLLNSDEFAQWASDNGKQILVLAHPEVAELFAAMPHAAGVEITSYQDCDVQTLLSQTALMITDYSSIAFDAAIAGAGIAYFQFDRDTYHRGGHITAPGYFDYRSDGFGPLVETLPELLAALTRAEATASGTISLGDFSGPLAKLALARDGHCCERVFQAISDLDQPYPAV